MQFQLIPLIRSLFIETNPIPVKAALALMGKCSGELRLPMTPMAESNLKKPKVAIARFRAAAKIRWHWELSSAESAGAWAAR